jgi:Uma2 family endonuclease
MGDGGLPFGMTSAYDIDMTVATLMTADELLRLPDDGWRYELVQGELRRMSPAGGVHGHIAARLIASLINHVEENGLGHVYASETGFRIARDPDTVRAPDAAVVRSERVVETAGFIEGVPDAAFEVTSPNDRYSQIEEKTLEWLRAGTRVVVVVDPATKSVRIHRLEGAINADTTLAVEDVIPGWKLQLAKLFA